MDQTDEQLVESYRQGDEEALQMLVDRHAKLVFNLAYRYAKSIADAEDIAQDTFVKAWKHLGRFDSKRKFKTWLLTIASNSARDWLRLRKPIVFSALETDETRFEDTLASQESSPDEDADALISSVRVREAIEKLGLSDQALIMLRNDEELTFQEIGEISKEPLNTVKSRYRRALGKLRKLLDSEAP